MIQIPKQLPVPMHEEAWQTLDSTKLQKFCACPRSYFYEYVLGWRPKAHANHLAFGRAWHSALEHLYKTGFKGVAEAYELFLSDYRKEWPESTDQWFKGKNPANALMGLVEYTNQYASDAYEIEVLETECGGLVWIGTAREIAVKIDLIGRKNGQVIALEHKTGSSLTDLWRDQWKTSIQIGSYLHTLNSYYSTEKATILVNGTFFSGKTRKFERLPYRRSGEQMLNWLNTVNTLIDRIEENFGLLAMDKDSNPILSSFPMQPTSCGNYGGCSYRDVCTIVANPLTIVSRDSIPSEFEEFWWNPLAEVKNELDKQSL